MCVLEDRSWNSRAGGSVGKGDVSTALTPAGGASHGSWIGRHFLGINRDPSPLSVLVVRISLLMNQPFGRLFHRRRPEFRAVRGQRGVC